MFDRTRSLNRRVFLLCECGKNQGMFFCIKPCAIKSLTNDATNGRVHFLLLRKKLICERNIRAEELGAQLGGQQDTVNLHTFTTRYCTAAGWTVPHTTSTIA